MPHFISWVVFGGIVITLLSSDGPINRFLTEIGILSSPIVFMAQPGNFLGNCDHLKFDQGIGLEHDFVYGSNCRRGSGIYMRRQQLTEQDVFAE